MYCESIEHGYLNPSGRKGVITIIPKKTKDDTYVKNWRPLTLLNYDYKIFTKLIANRLESVVDSIVGKQQTGFIKNRRISMNLMKTMEVVAYTNKTNSPGIVTSVDFEKCFDRIEYSSINGSLKYFGFGEYLRKLVSVIFGKFQICTQNNGFVSKFQNKTRGVNQGCPTSPMVYVVCSETLVHRIKLNQKIACNNSSKNCGESRFGA